MPAGEARKTFVLDTNVILHDSSCLTQFKRHAIVIPITVLEELDQFKKGNQSINYHAREFLRSLDALGGEAIFADGGVPIGPGHGTVRIQLERELHPDLSFNFSRGKPDDLILNCAYSLAREKKRTRVVLVSKDVNLRLKAKAVGLLSEDYTTDHVKDVSTLYTGKREVADLDVEVIDSLYAGGAVAPEHLGLGTPLRANESLILRNHQKSALARYDADGLVRRVNKAPVFGIAPRNAEQTFALNVLCNPDIPLVSLTGTAGTGKTLLALAAALEQRRHYRQIFLARPIVPLSNKDIGYLPGEVKAKLDPYMQPIYDNLAVIMSHHGNGDGKPANQQIQQMLDEEKLTVSALPYIRGRSLNRIYFIVDEAQNLTPHEVKTIITRAGEGTKIVFTGDVFQIDHPYLDALSNGLSYLIEKMQGQPLYAHVNLEKGERSKLAHLASELL